MYLWPVATYFGAWTPAFRRNGRETADCRVEAAAAAAVREVVREEPALRPGQRMRFTSRRACEKWNGVGVGSFK